MATELTRLYIVPDGTMLMRAAVFYQLFVDDDEADFFAFSEVIFGPAFKTDFDADILAAHQVLKDFEVVGDQKIETQEFLEKLKECDEHHHELKFFVKKAYPGNKAMITRFGFPKYKKARDSQDSMILFMEILANAAKKFKVKLIAQGYTQARIDELNTLAAELDQEGMEQEDAKSDRLLRTRERIIAMNKVWNRMVSLNRASKNIYRDNYTKLKQYELPPATPSSAEPLVKMKFNMKVIQKIVNFGWNVNGTIHVGWGDDTENEFTGDGSSTGFFNKTYVLMKIFTAFITGALSGFVELHINDSNLSYIKFHKSMSAIKEIILQNNLLPTKVVDQVLVDVNKFGTGGPGRVLNLMGNAAPSAKGLQAKAELEARGWVVLVS